MAPLQELPSIEEIEEMDRQRQQAIESLEISKSASGGGDCVKCQKCDTVVPIVGKLSISHYSSSRITTLQARIRRVEEGKSSKKSSSRTDDYKELKRELADLQKLEAKKDILRRLSLYSAKMTGYKYVCSSCWDQIYWSNYNNKK